MKENIKRVQPKYKIGTYVSYPVMTTDPLTKLEFENFVDCYVSEIYASGDSVKDTYDYGLSISLPGVYYSGKPPFKRISEDNLGNLLKTP